MTATYSPAPWSYQYSPYTVRDPGADATSNTGDELPAFEVFDADGNKVFDTNEDTPADLQEANACLASAAPKLFEELSYFLDFAELNDDGEDEDFTRRISAARLAIAKATGRAA